MARSAPEGSPVMWILVACHGFHILEEYLFDLPAWARSVGVQVGWQDFHILNAALLLFGICAAMTAWSAPAFSLSFPAHLLLNALFHLSASAAGGHLNPGVFTSTLLFIPLGIACFSIARRDGVLTRRRVLIALAIAGAVHSTPLVFVVLR
jgi:hypothetical protein